MRLFLKRILGVIFDFLMSFYRFRMSTTTLNSEKIQITKIEVERMVIVSVTVVIIRICFFLFIM